MFPKDCVLERLMRCWCNCMPTLQLTLTNEWITWSLSYLLSALSFESRSSCGFSFYRPFHYVIPKVNIPFPLIHDSSQDSLCPRGRNVCGLILHSKSIQQPKVNLNLARVSTSETSRFIVVLSLPFSSAQQVILFAFISLNLERNIAIPIENPVEETENLAWLHVTRTPFHVIGEVVLCKKLNR